MVEQRSAEAVKIVEQLSAAVKIVEQRSAETVKIVEQLAAAVKIVEQRSAETVKLGKQHTTESVKREEYNAARQVRT